MSDHLKGLMKQEKLVMNPGDKFLENPRSKKEVVHKEVPEGLRLIALSPEEGEKWIEQKE